MRRLLPTIVCFLFGLATPVSATFGQASRVPVSGIRNADVMGALAAECALTAAPGPGPVRVTGLEVVSYVRSAVVTALLEGGYTVHEPGADAPGVPHVGLTPEVLTVEYARADRQNVSRRIEVRLRALVTNPDGTVARDEACTRTSVTLVERAAVPDLEDAADPRTHAPLPPAGGFLRRIVQPAVIGAATAAGVFLFFSLRSRRAGSGE